MCGFCYGGVGFEYRQGVRHRQAAVAFSTNGIRDERLDGEGMRRISSEYCISHGVGIVLVELGALPFETTAGRWWEGCVACSGHSGPEPD